MAAKKKTGGKEAEEKKVEEAKEKKVRKAEEKPVEKGAGKKVTEEKKPEKKEARKGQGEETREEKPKKPAAKEVKEKKKPSYRISRTPEAVKMAREKSRLEKKKAKFKRQNQGKMKRVPERWRMPTGIDSGHQDFEKGKPGHPRAGYMTPPRVRGLHPSGFSPVRVFNADGLVAIDPKTQAILIAGSVGRRKRREIQKLAQDKGIQILNYKEI
jgi:large subunit ribosomal protein L32e